MKAKTLWQPWASLVACGAKPFETRSYPPPPGMIGKRFAIHAAARPIFPITRDMEDTTRIAIYNALYQRMGMLMFDDLPLGAVVCTAVLAEAAQVDRRGTFRFPSGDGAFVEPDRFGDYSPGRWVWRLADVIKLTPPVQWKGRQGWFDVEVPGEG